MTAIELVAPFVYLLLLQDSSPMTDSQKLVLMIQSTKLQGAIWQAVLKSQKISVIWEAPDTDLLESIEQLQQAGLTLPDLLLIDVRLQQINPFELCRWCRDRYPALQVILTDTSQTEISQYERRWAVYQGAADLLPGFQRDNLVSSVATAVKRVLEVLDSHPLNNGALISVLLAMKRQLELSEAEAAKPKIDKVAKTEPIPVNEKSAESKPSDRKGKVIPIKPLEQPTEAPAPNPKLSYRFAKYPSSN